MNRSSRSSIIGGVILIVVGAGLLAGQFIPGWSEWFNMRYAWPLIIVAFGALWLLLAFTTGKPEFAMPGAIFGGIGGLLYWQNATGHWASWAYAWTLIPGFAGVGTILMGLLGKEPMKNFRAGAWLVFISAVLFAIFGAFLGGMNYLGAYWPLLLIVLGVVLLARNFWQAR